MISEGCHSDRLCFCAVARASQESVVAITRDRQSPPWRALPKIYKVTRYIFRLRSSAPKHTTTSSLIFLFLARYIIAMRVAPRTSVALGFALTSFVGLSLAQGPQNPFGSANGGSLNGAGASGSQNPFGNTGAASGSGSQNPFGNTGAASGSGSQNPFGNSGAASGSGSQNPFVPPTTGGNTGGSTGGSTGGGPLLDGDGCPAVRAAPPTDNLIYAGSPICPSGKRSA